MTLTKVTPALTGHYKTVAALLLSNEPSRGVGAAWPAGEFSFTEAASAASDNHEVTAGGIKPYYAGYQTTHPTLGTGIVIGTADYDPNTIGGGSILISGSTAQPNRLPGTGQLRAIVGGYDCEIEDGAVDHGIACAIFGSHHSEILGDETTHASIFGGSLNIIRGGDYGSIGGGTANEIKALRKDGITAVAAHRSRISGGSGNIIYNAGSAIAGGQDNSIDGVYSFIGAGNDLVAEGNFDVIAGGGQNETRVGGNGTGQKNTIGGGRNNLIDGVTTCVSNTIGGGELNEAYGSENTVSGGKNNEAGSAGTSVNDAVIAGGLDNLVGGASTAAAVSGGRSNNASANYSTVIGGRNNRTNGDYSTASGQDASAEIPHSQTLGGSAFYGRGDAQTTLVVRKAQTTDATLTAMTTMVLPDDSTWAFEVLIVARRTDADNESAGYKISGVIDRNTGVATTALVAAITKTVLGEDTAAWDVDAIANAASGGLQIQVTGEAAKAINWVARVELSEVTG